MNIEEIKEKKKHLITGSNPEWQNILDLSAEVQKDFYENESLSIPTYIKILAWKLHNQKSRIDQIKNSSPDSLIKSITHCYCTLNHPDNEMKTRIQTHVLLSIPWIGIGIASAIMTLHEPRLYGVIDLRTWSVLFDKEKKTFSMNDYLKYLENIRQLADKAECDVREIDYILWKQYET
ncbi:MAG: hypothetical protein GY765_31955 [bacterium]|nr:hypothetical protein [bacterium]